ncbi:TonB-dependent receptor [Pseudoteredinibacter isoporae]|uniref:TonB-dependent receptor n=1 Tax=Pseudoteredinibacter isoporae TaxID=570281 RepID=UPI003102E777
MSQSSAVPSLKTLLSLGVTLACSTSYAAVIEEVVVTAQKRSQSVNDIGVSANAFAGDSLQDYGVDSPVDLGNHTPGLITVNATSGGTPIFAIRGIGLDDFSANNSSGVGVYTDEVFASSPAYLGGRLFDVERVEVLKGPQGTLYGKNTTGGAINFISNKPTDEFEAYAELSLARHDTRELTAVVSGPLSDGLRGRLAFNGVRGDGWQTDINTGREFGDQDRAVLRGLLDFDLGSDGDVLIKAYYSQDQSTPASPHAEGVDDVLGDSSFSVLNSPRDPSRVTVGDLPVFRDENGQGFSIKVNYAFDAFDLVSITAWDSYERQVLDNYDGGAHSATDLSQDNELEQWSQELRLVGDIGESFSWIAGVNVSREEVDVKDSFDDSILLSDSVAFDGVLNPFDINNRGDDLFIADYVQETDSYGVYVHTETDLSDEVKLIAGVRYSYDDRQFNGSADNLSFGELFPVTTLRESHDEEAVTGKIGLDWFVHEDLLLFANVASSYKSGIFYGGAVVDSSAWSYIGPESVLSYELGFKWTGFDGSMQLNGAIFRMDYSDRQSLLTFVSDDFSNLLGVAVVDTTLANVPESRTQGFEMDLNWLPMDGLTIQAGLSYLDAEVTEAPTLNNLRGINPDPSVNDAAILAGSGFVDALGAPLNAGSDLSQAPQWSYNGLLAYEFDLSETLMMRLQSSYSWVDEQFAQLADSNAQYGPVRALNARVSVEQSDGKWQLSFWGRNLEDKASETYAFTGFAGRTVYRQQGATYGLTLRYNF